MLPVAVEYCFWTERRPEVLIAVGQPVPIGDGSAAAAGVWAARVRDELERTQNLLAEAAQRGDPDAFVSLLGGRQGVGGVYDLFGWLRARRAGRSFVAAHRALVPPEPGPTGAVQR